MRERAARRRPPRVFSRSSGRTVFPQPSGNGAGSMWRPAAASSAPRKHKKKPALRELGVAQRGLTEESGVRFRDTFLTLAALEPLPRTRLAGFLALLHARIASEKPFRFERRPEFRIGSNQGSRDCEANSTGLAGETATG